jgi:hypothetical protein
LQHWVAAHKLAREWQTEKQQQFSARLKVAEAALEANEGAKDVKKGEDAPEAIKAFKRLLAEMSRANQALGCTLSLWLPVLDG